MQPAPGQLYRSYGGSLYRVEEIALDRVGDCVRCSLVEPGAALVSDWEGQAETNKLPQLLSDVHEMCTATTFEGVRDFYMARPYWRELAWFERAAKLVREAA